MAVRDFYNTNAGRRYPIVETGDIAGHVYPSGAPFTLEHKYLLDVGFVWEVDALFDPASHNVWLQSITRSSNEVYFDFVSDCPGMESRVVRFARCVVPLDPWGAIDYESARGAVEKSSSSSSSSLSVSACSQGAGDYVDDVCTGFLVTGDLSDLVGSLSDGQSACFSGRGLLVEPAVSQTLHLGFVRNVNLANDRRTAVTQETSSSSGPEEPIVMKIGIVGDIQFMPGYNSLITVSESDNSILFEASVGAGAGEPCEAPPLEPEESSSSSSSSSLGKSSSSSSSGSSESSESSIPGAQAPNLNPLCDEVIATLNGIEGPHITISTGPGFEVVTDPDNHSIDITFTRTNMFWCISYAPPSSSSSSAPKPEAPWLVYDNFEDRPTLGRHWKTVEGEVRVLNSAIAGPELEIIESSSSSVGDFWLIADNFVFAFGTNLGPNWSEVEGDVGALNNAIGAFPVEQEIISSSLVSSSSVSSSSKPPAPTISSSLSSSSESSSSNEPEESSSGESESSSSSS